MGVESTQLISTSLLSLKMRYSAFFWEQCITLPLKSTKHLKQNLLYSPYFKISISKVTFKYGCLKLAFMMDSYATRDERKKINISQVPPTPTPHSSQSGKGGCLREKEPACSDLSLFGQK